MKARGPGRPGRNGAGRPRGERCCGGASGTNAFRDEFLHRLLERDQPATAVEAATAGPWTVVAAGPRGWGVVRQGEGAEPDGDRVAAWLDDRGDALLWAAALPASGRRGEVGLRPERGPDGYELVAGRHRLGRVAWFDPELAAVMAALRQVVASPWSLALLLEAAGYDALERAGRLLAGRTGAPDGEA